MPRTNYGGNFYRVWKQAREKRTRIPRPRVGETWVFVEPKELEKKSDGFSTGEKVMGAMAASGVIVSFIENVGKGIGIVHSFLTQGYQKTKDKGIENILVFNPKKDAQESMKQVHATLTKIWKEQREIKSDMAALKRGMAILLQDGAEGKDKKGQGAVVKGKGKNGDDDNGGSNGNGSGGNGNGGNGSGGNGSGGTGGNGSNGISSVVGTIFDNFS